MRRPGSRLASYAAALLAAFRGREAEAAPLIQATLEQAAAGGQGARCRGRTGWPLSSTTAWAAMRRRWRRPGKPARTSTRSTAAWALPELIEAAARTGSMRSRPRRPGSTGREELGPAAPTGRWGSRRGRRALLSEGEQAERLYREAIDRLGRTRLRPELARAHLLYGEWLRRAGAAARPASSCAPRTTCSKRSAWRRSPRGPAASCGPPARPPASARSAAADGELTVQEAQIARLARDGLSNPEIGARLFLSPAPSSTTWAKYSPSSASPRAASCAASCPLTPTPPRRANGRRPGPPASRGWPVALATPADPGAARSG